MPFADFEKTFYILDYKRLGKQRQETLQILKAMLGIVKHYKSQSAARAWKGCERGLCEYGIKCCNMWRRRGYQDNTQVIFEEILKEHLKDRSIVYPRWIGYEPFHSNQRAILLGKNYLWYNSFNWSESPTDIYEFPEHLYNV